MKKMKMKYTEITITVRNQREEKLARIFNNQLERIHEYISKDDKLAESIKEGKADHWLMKELGGQASALYYMDMIKKPITAYQLWLAIKYE